MLRKVLGALKRLLRRAEASSAPDAPGAAIRHYIDWYQRAAWDRLGLADRVQDAAYPFSGHFDPPPAVENDIAHMLALSGSAAGRPIIRKEPLTTAYQEKVTLPFLWNSWTILEATHQVPETLRLQQNLFLATTPGGHFYPEIHADQRGDYAVIYDGSLLFTFLMAACLLSRTCSAPETRRAANDPGCWADGFTLARDLPELALHNAAITDFARLLATLVKYGHPFHPGGLTISEGTFVPRIIRDIYTFTLAHEIGHIQLGHMKIAEGGGSLQERERAADLHAFALYSNAMKADLGGNFAAYVHAAFCFHIMAYIYRAVNLIRQHPDYGFWPPGQLMQLYFPPDSWGFHPHPRARLDLLRREIRARGAPPDPTELTRWDKIIDTFFETLWKLMHAELARHHGAIHPTWSHIAEHHERATQST